jgi:hypothetical protein
MIYIILALVTGTIVTITLMHKPLLRLIAHKRAISKIESIIFSGSDQRVSKTEVLETIHEFTANRLNDDLVLDYFYKIKGLQVLNINKPMNFWLKIYLTSPTKIKLNYFEQVKFYDTFLNYPRIDSDRYNERIKKRKHTNSIQSIKTELVQKFA